jgi:predicted metal-dependent enzyme (double-stranded beta helix superfamily)
MKALREFVSTATQVLGHTREEGAILTALKPAFAGLIAQDDWLPSSFAQPHPNYYQQYLLHCDPLERFSVVSFVWGPGQKTPIHNHTVWGLIGVLRGAEIATRYDAPVAGQPMVAQGEERLEAGMVDVVSPDLGDIHLVRNAFEDQVSISIHVYGANIGKVARQVFDPHTGTPKSFVSGFSSDVLPNIWA